MCFCQRTQIGCIVIDHLYCEMPFRGGGWRGGANVCATTHPSLPGWSSGVGKSTPVNEACVRRWIYGIFNHENGYRSKAREFQVIGAIVIQGQGERCRDEVSLKSVDCVFGRLFATTKMSICD